MGNEELVEQPEKLFGLLAAADRLRAAAKQPITPGEATRQLGRVLEARSRTSPTGGVGARADNRTRAASMSRVSSGSSSFPASGSQAAATSIRSASPNRSAA
jgi:hypothetical protein